MEKTVDLILHDAQWQIFDDPRRFRVACNGRRFGKTALGINELVMASLMYQEPISKLSPQTVIGALPTAVQARPILFKPLCDYLTSGPLVDLVVDINKSEMRIDLLGKPSIKIAGANDQDGDRLRGKRMAFILLDECQDIKPTVWHNVIGPAMLDTAGSRALFTGTPKGKQNILYHLAEMAKTDPDYAFFNFPSSANPYIDRAKIAKAKATLPPRVFEQEYEANFVNFPGQFYSELDSLNLHESDELPHLDLVVAGVDFGDIHPAISVVGLDRREDKWYWLEGWSPNTGRVADVQPVTRQQFDFNLKRLVHKYGVHRIYCDPSRPSEILAIRGLGGDLVWSSTEAGFNGIASGIGQVHSLIHQKKLVFVKNIPETDGCPPEYAAAVSGQLAYDYHLSYHRVERKGILTDEPADGDFSHICDSTRYALAAKGR